MGSDQTYVFKWVLYELARHPEVQARVREEVIASPAEPSYDDLLERVPYLDAVLKECLRFHPAILELTHVVSPMISFPERLRKLILPHGSGRKRYSCPTLKTSARNEGNGNGDPPRGCHQHPSKHLANGC